MTTNESRAVLRAEADALEIDFEATCNWPMPIGS
jgi:hypothetical protein